MLRTINEMFWARALGAALAGSSLLSKNRSVMLCQPDRDEKDEKVKEQQVSDVPNPSSLTKV